MGNKQDAPKEAGWAELIEKELAKIQDIIPPIKVKDKYRKDNVQRLNQTLSTRQVQVRSVSQSLFITVCGELSAKKRSNPHLDFRITHLVKEPRQESKAQVDEILQVLARCDGILKDIMDAFRKTQLPSVNSSDADQVILRFIDTFVNIIIHYYDLVGFCRELDTSFLNKEALKNLVTNMVFTEELYSTIYQLKKAEQIQINEQVHAQLFSAGDKSLKDYGISVKFCLNESTREYIRSRQSSRKTKSIIQSELTDTSNQFEYTPIVIESVDRESLPSRPAVKQQPPTFFRDCPYQEAIDSLNSIQYHQTPHHKLKALTICFQNIYLAIQDYYLQFSQEPSILSTDELIIIFGYILSRSRLQNPYTHYDLMYTYCGNKDGVEGYYLSIMLSTMQMI